MIFDETTIHNLADDKDYSLDEVAEILGAYQSDYQNKKAAIMMHRLMWSWIHNQTMIRDMIMTKLDFHKFLQDNLYRKMIVRRPYNACFLCDYIYKMRFFTPEGYRLSCKDCLAIWSGPNNRCCAGRGEYVAVEKYLEYLAVGKNGQYHSLFPYIEAAARIARIPMKMETKTSVHALDDIEKVLTEGVGDDDR